MTPSWRTCGVAHSLYSSLTKADSILEDFEMLVLRSAIYFLIDCDDLWKKWPFLFLYGIWWCESSDWLSSLSFSMIFFILDLIRDYLWPLSSSNRGGWQEIPGLTLNFRFCNPHPCLVRSCRSPLDLPITRPLTNFTELTYGHAPTRCVVASALLPGPEWRGQSSSAVWASSTWQQWTSHYLFWLLMLLASSLVASSLD